MPQRIPKIQIGRRQVSEYHEGGMPFGLGDGLALTVTYVTGEPQSILKLRLSGTLGLLTGPASSHMMYQKERT